MLDIIVNKNKDDINGSEILLNQIHEQFAINNNSYIGAMITIFISLIIVVGYYGVYVLDRLEPFHLKGSPFTFLTIGICIILTFLIFLNLFLGLKMRKEQLVIDRIRRHYDRDGKIFGEGGIVEWKGTDKKIENFCPGLYGFISKMLIILILIISFLSIMLLFNNGIDKDKNNCNCLYSNLILLSDFILLICIAYGWINYYHKYREYEKNNLHK